MKFLLPVCLLLAFQSHILALDVVVGSTPLSIPEPAGFTLVTDSMQPYADLAKRFVPPSNEQFALYLSATDTAAVTRGEVPASERNFSVQTGKQLVQPFVTSAEFAELKKLIKTQNETILKKAEADMPGLMKKMSKGVSDDYKVDVNLAVNQMLPFPPHLETDRSMAYSMKLKYAVTEKDGETEIIDGVVTVTFIHLKGKILFLYANAEKEGLEWSQVESKKWTEAIVAANPSSETVAAQESRAPQKDFDWSRVIVGALLGGIFGLFRYGFTKKTKIG